jgi:hypothetical protein
MMRTSSRALAVVGVSAVALAVTVGPAVAQSPPIPYSCSWSVADVDGTGDATATWDSGIPDSGLTIPPNVTFSLDPFTGVVVVPDTFAQELRDQGVTEVGGTGSLQIYWDAAGGYGDGVIGLAFAATPVPASGPMTLDLDGVSGLTTSLNEMEPWSLVAGDFTLTADSGASTLSCRTTPSGVIDTVNTIVDITTAPPSTSGTPTSSADPTTTSPSATRPALVQTDAAPPTGPSPTALAGFALVAGAALVTGALAARRRSALRRH